MDFLGTPRPLLHLYHGIFTFPFFTVPCALLTSARPPPYSTVKGGLETGFFLPHWFGLCPPFIPDAFLRLQFGTIYLNLFWSLLPLVCFLPAPKRVLSPPAGRLRWPVCYPNGSLFRNFPHPFAPLAFLQDSCDERVSCGRGCLGTIPLFFWLLNLISGLNLRPLMTVLSSFDPGF